MIPLSLLIYRQDSQGHLPPYMGKRRLLGIFRHTWLTTNIGQNKRLPMINQNLTKHPPYMAVIFNNEPHMAGMNLLNPGLK
jgi:hypothetical protein